MAFIPVDTQRTHSPSSSEESLQHWLHQPCLVKSGQNPLLGRSTEKWISSSRKKNFALQKGKPSTHAQFHQELTDYPSFWTDRSFPMPSTPPQTIHFMQYIHFNTHFRLAPFFEQLQTTQMNVFSNSKSPVSVLSNVCTTTLFGLVQD